MIRVAKTKALISFAAHIMFIYVFLSIFFLGLGVNMISGIFTIRIVYW